LLGQRAQRVEVEPGGSGDGEERVLAEHGEDGGEVRLGRGRGGEHARSVLAARAEGRISRAPSPCTPPPRLERPPSPPPRRTSSPPPSPPRPPRRAAPRAPSRPPPA